jgi:hypothetical protein
MLQAFRTMVRSAIPAMLLLALAVAHAPMYAQNISGSITGVVQDSTNAVIPGAEVSLTNQEQGGAPRLTVTNASGVYLFSALPAGLYTLRVETPGFAAYTQTDIRLFVNNRLGLDPIRMEVGGIGQSIVVEAPSVQLETVTAERSGIVTGTQLTEIAVNGRNFTALLKTVPGAPADSGNTVQSFNGQRADQNNFTIDGQTVIDTGVNLQFAYRLNVDAIEEMKVSTNSQSAEFGRNSGAQIQVATKSGGSEFHGGGYFFRRNEGWNANSFTNNRNGVPRQPYDFRQVGYTIGGPVVRERLFFFMSHEWLRSEAPNAPNRIRVPTLAERQGDFSQTVDGAGVAVAIVDPLTGDPFAGNRIPEGRISAYGRELLGWLPEPNVFGDPTHNYESQEPNRDPAFDEVYRVDYTIHDNWRAYGRVLRSHQTQTRPYGRADTSNDLGLSDLTAPTFGWSVAANVATVISPTLTNEFQYGYTKNGIPGDPPPEGSPYYRSVSGVTLPLLYPDADPLVGSDFGGAQGIVPNVWIDPISGWNGHYTDFNGTPYFNENPVWNISDNVSKVIDTHMLKFGLFIEHAVKSENAFQPVGASIDFSRDPSNPGDTGWGMANVLVGNFREYRQFSKSLVPRYPYWNIEWYGQDSWKATDQLTINLGLRMSLVPPLYEESDLITNFDPSTYDPARAVRLYEPNADGLAFDPVTGEIRPAVLIGAIVPGSGDMRNGMVRAGADGTPRGLKENRGIQWGPRVGLAYQLNDNTVIRAGGGVFYERTATFTTSATTAFLANPPEVQLSQTFYGNLDSLQSSQGVDFPLQLKPLSTDGHVPTTYNFSLGVQRELPWEVLLDVSYVGTESRHLVENQPFNFVPFGSAWLPENQDPNAADLQFDGTTTKLAQLYRPYPGLTTDATVTFGGSSNYNALQVAANRRVGSGLQLGLTYTWSRALGTSGSAGFLGTSTGHPFDTRGSNYGLLSLDRSHGMTINYTYDLPTLDLPNSMGNNILEHAINGWQISGLTSLSVGAPTTVTYSVSGIGGQALNRMITGSEDVAPRVVLTCDPNLPRGERTIERWIDTSCFAPAAVGSTGNDSGLNTIRGPGLNNWDISIFKKFQYGENVQQYLQLRLEMFNAFNHTNWGGFNTNVQFDPMGDVVNLPSQVGRNGFGALTSVRGNSQRIIQLAAKIYF